jgi:hypothetical protein
MRWLLPIGAPCEFFTPIGRQYNSLVMGRKAAGSVTTGR